MRGKILIFIVTSFILFFGLIVSLNAMKASTIEMMRMLEKTPIQIKSGRFKIIGEDIQKVNVEISQIRVPEGIILIRNSRFRVFE